MQTEKQPKDGFTMYATHIRVGYVVFLQCFPG